MKTINWKRLAYDLMIDIIAGVLIGIGVYNFAANSGFPLAGVSGIALIFYRLVGIPIGLGSILLNIPIILGCYKTLGKEFFFAFHAFAFDYIIFNRLYSPAVSGIFRRPYAGCYLYGNCFWAGICADIYE